MPFKKAMVSYVLLLLASSVSFPAFAGAFADAVATPVASAAVSAYSASQRAELVTSFCNGIPGSQNIKDVLPKPSVKQAADDIDWLTKMFNGLSREAITEKSVLKGLSVADANQARLFAIHVREGNLVSAQMVLSLGSQELQRSFFGQLANRFLRSAYHPFMESQDPDEKDLNRELRLAQAKLTAGLSAMGEAATSAFARWHIQSHVYYDNPAREATRQALCANATFRALIPSVFNGIKAFQSVK